LHLTIASRFVHGTMPLTLVTPAGGGPHRPLLVFLHGLYCDNNSQLTDQMFAALRALGPHAPDVAFPYGDQSWWVNGTGGAWASYVLDEVIPKALTALHADPRRVAIGGISMGGFGAYATARLDPGRFCAVGGQSAAIYPGTGDPVDLIAAATANPKLYGHAQLWLDVGAHGFSQSSGIPNVWNYWIIYPAIAWVLLTAGDAWWVFGHRPISEAEIKREIERRAGQRR
jgi:pimeloyl-ACP methyl ester carboxylesterase